MDKKLINQVSNFRKWKKKEKFSPLRAEIQISNKCNLNCKYCGGSPVFNRKQMSFKKLKNVVQELLNLEVEEFHFTGAESAVRVKELIKLIEIIKKSGKKTLIATNGTLLNESNIKKLVQVGCDEIFISLDSHLSKIHNYLRNSKNTYEKVVETLNFLKKWKLKYNKRKPEITSVIVITSFNYNNLLDYIKFVKDLGITQITFQPLIVCNEESKKFSLSKNQLEKFNTSIKEIKKTLKKYDLKSNNIENLSKEYFEKSSKSFQILSANVNKNNEDEVQNILCFDAWSSIAILSNGFVGPCIHIAEEGGISLMENSLKECWYSNFNSIRKNTFLKNYPKSCRNCKFCSTKLIEIKKAKEIAY